jgi:hypothetical protein
VQSIVWLFAAVALLFGFLLKTGMPVRKAVFMAIGPVGITSLFLFIVHLWSVQIALLEASQNSQLTNPSSLLVTIAVVAIIFAAKGAIWLGLRKQRRHRTALKTIAR